MFILTSSKHFTAVLMILNTPTRTDLTMGVSKGRRRGGYTLPSHKSASHLPPHTMILNTNLSISTTECHVRTDDIAIWGTAGQFQAACAAGGQAFIAEQRLRHVHRRAGPCAGCAHAHRGAGWAWRDMEMDIRAAAGTSGDRVLASTNTRQS